MTITNIVAAPAKRSVCPTTRLSFIALILALSIAFPFGAAHADDFHPISSVSSSTSASDLWPASNLIHGPGTGFAATEPHARTSGGSGGLWVTDDPGGFPSDYYIAAAAPPVITLDLGADVYLPEISVWGYDSGNGNGVSRFSLRFATDADGATGFGSSISYNPTYFPDNIGVTARQSFPFATPVTARYVEFTAEDNFFGAIVGGDRVGLGEIAFEQNSPVPASGGSALVALDTRSFGDSGSVALETSQVTVNDNGDGGSNVEPVVFTRDDSASDTLYFRYTVNPISDFTTENYFAGLQLYQGGAERLGVGNAFGPIAYSAYNTTGVNVDLNSANPEGGVLWERVRKGVPRTIVFRVDYVANGADDVTVWLDPDCTLAESAQIPTSVTAFTADASFDQVRLREGVGGVAGADGWTFSDIFVGELFYGYAAAAAAKIPDGAPRGFGEDADDDELSNGAEYALGTGMATSDVDSPRVPTVTENGSGQVEIQFGFNLAAAPDTAWVVLRSTDLDPGSFTEIYRFDGPSLQQTLPGGIGASMTADSITVTDQNPPSPRAFYVFGAEQVVP